MRSASERHTVLPAHRRLGTAFLSVVVMALMCWCSVTVISSPQAQANAGYVLADGHADIFYALAGDNALGLALKEDVSGSDVLHFPEDVTLAIGDNAYSQDVAEVPEIGTPGYYLPQTQQPGILWPGWSTQQVASQGLEQVDFTFDSVTGPGDVYIFTQRGLGDLGPILGDGSFLLQSGSVLTQSHPAHVHANWVFTQPGTYEMTVSAHSGGFSSQPHTYIWEVGGNPSTSIADDALQAEDILQGQGSSPAPADDPQANPNQAPGEDFADAPRPLDPEYTNGSSGAQVDMPDTDTQDLNAGQGAAQSGTPDQGFVPDQSGSDSATQSGSSDGLETTDGEGWNTPASHEADTSQQGTSQHGASSQGMATQKSSRPHTTPAKAETGQKTGAGQKAGAEHRLCAGLVLRIKDDRQQPPQWRKPEELSFGLGDNARVDLPRALGPLEPGPVWMVGATQQDGVPWVGANTQHPSIREHIDGGLTWTLTGFSGPGTMFVYEQGNLGKVVGKEWFRGQGTTAEGSVDIPENTHVHPNWVFSQPGTYEVTITQSGTDKDGSSISGTGTITFHVGDTASSDATEGHFDIGAERVEALCSPTQAGNPNGSAAANAHDDALGEESSEASADPADSSSSDRAKNSASSTGGTHGHSQSSGHLSPASQHRVKATSQQESSGVAWEAIVIALLGILIGVVGGLFYRSARRQREEL